MTPPTNGTKAPANKDDGESEVENDDDDENDANAGARGRMPRWTRAENAWIIATYPDYDKQIAFHNGKEVDDEGLTEWLQGTWKIFKDLFENSLKRSGKSWRGVSRIRLLVDLSSLLTASVDFHAKI